jgi:hypothetical protein
MLASCLSKIFNSVIGLIPIDMIYFLRPIPVNHAPDNLGPEILVIFNANSPSAFAQISSDFPISIKHPISQLEKLVEQISS